MKIQKTIQLISIVCVVLLCVVTEASAQTYWNENCYAKYTYQTYTNYAPFNQVIDPYNFDARLLNAAVYYETCRQRVNNGLPVHKYLYALEVSAQNHTYDMVKYDFFSHESPVAGKKEMATRISQAGVQYWSAAENILYRSIGSTETYVQCAKNIVNQWMNSPGHRRNILDSSNTHMGAGTAIYKSGSFIYVKSTQNFAQPR